MRKIKLLIFMCAFIMCCSSCSNKTGTVTEINSTTVTVAVRKGEKSTWESVTKNFRTINPNINLKFIELGSELEQYRLLTSALSSGECAFDAMEIEDVWLEEFVDKGYVFPLNANISGSGRDMAFAKEAFRKGDVQYAVPFQADIGMLLVSKQYEWTGDLYALKNENKSGTSVSGDSSEKSDVISTIMELTAYADNNVEEAVELYKSIYGQDYRGEEALKLFGEGKLKAVRAWSSVLPRFREGLHVVPGDYRVFNMPLGKDGHEISVAKIFGMAISSLTDKREECEAFIKYCNSDEFQISWIENTATYPVRKELFDNASINSEWNHISNMKDRIENVQTRPRNTKYTENTDKLSTSIDLYLSDGVDLEKVSGQIKQFLETQ